MPACRASCAATFSSSTISLSNSAGVVGAGSAPSAPRRCWKELHAAGHHIGQRLGNAFVRHVDHVDLRMMLEHLSREMRCAACSGRSEIELAGFRSGEREQVFCSRYAERRRGNEEIAGGARASDPREIPGAARLPQKSKSCNVGGMITRRSLMKARFGCALAAALITAAPAVVAQTYPVKPIRLILPFAGGTELIGRMVGGKLSPILGQQIVADPRLGAAGNIGWEAAAKAPADGYTLVMGAVPVLTNPHLNPKVAYDPLRSFAPIALLATIPNIIVVHPSVPAKTMRELIQLARNNPTKIAYGSGGVGSANHLAGEFLQSLAKVRFTHVPYKSATLGLTGAMSGDVDMVIVVVSSTVSLMNAGKMRGLAILDTKRNASAPEVPTSAEAGIPQLLAVNWYALLAPAGTPRPIIDRLNAESVKAMNTPETRASLAAMGGEPTATTPERTADFLREEYARWGKVIREANIKAE